MKGEIKLLYLVKDKNQEFFWMNDNDDTSCALLPLLTNDADFELIKKFEDIKAFKIWFKNQDVIKSRIVKKQVLKDAKSVNWL